MPIRRTGPALLLLALYATASHFAMTHAPERWWTVVLVLAPVLVSLAGIGARRGARLALPLGVAALAAAGAAVLQGRLPGFSGIKALYVLQHAGIHLALGIAFAASHRGDRDTMISALARRIHGGSLTRDMERYTRKVNALWVGYFFTMALVSVGVCLWAPWAVWSVLANLVTPLAIGSLLVGEYLLRYWLHPEFERTTLVAALRASQSVLPR